MDKEYKNAFNLIYNTKFREQIQQNPRSNAKDLFGEGYNDELEYSVSVSTKDIMYFTIPYYNQNVSFSNINAAGKISTAGSGGSVGTLGSACGTLSTAASISSASTGGSMD